MENARRNVPAHGYPEGILRVFGWVSMGYPWVSGVSSQGGYAAPTTDAKHGTYKNTWGTMGRNAHALHEKQYYTL